MALSDEDKAIIQQGYNIALAAGMSPSGAAQATGQGWAESYLGTKGQFVKPDGTPSWNWGAARASSSSPCIFGGGDTLEGKKVSVQWACFDSLEAGFAYWRNIGSIKAAWAAMNAGDCNTIAAILFDRGYFTGFPNEFERCSAADRNKRISDYAALLANNTAAVKNNLGLTGIVISRDTPIPDRTGVKSPCYNQSLKSDSNSVSILGLGLLTVGAVWTWKSGLLKGLG